MTVARLPSSNTIRRTLSLAVPSIAVRSTRTSCCFPWRKRSDWRKRRISPGFVATTLSSCRMRSQACASWSLHLRGCPWALNMSCWVKSVAESKRLLTLLVPVFNEEQNIEPLYAALQPDMAQLSPDYDFEILFTDNHSTD